TRPLPIAINPTIAVAIFTCRCRFLLMTSLPSKESRLQKMVRRLVMRGNYVGVSRFVKKSVVVTGTLCIAFFVCSADGSSQKVATQGNPIPEFKLSDLDGKSFKSSQLRGRVVLLDLWATWCEPCLEDIPMLNRLY